MLDPTKDSTKLIIVGLALLTSMMLLFLAAKVAAVITGTVFRYHSKPTIQLVKP